MPIEDRIRYELDAEYEQALAQLKRDGKIEVSQLSNRVFNQLDAREDTWGADVEYLFIDTEADE